MWSDKESSGIVESARPVLDGVRRDAPFRPSSTSSSASVLRMRYTQTQTSRAGDEDGRSLAERLSNEIEFALTRKLVRVRGEGRSRQVKVVDPIQRACGESVDTESVQVVSLDSDPWSRCL